MRAFGWMVLLAAAGLAAPAHAEAFDPAPWLADLEQTRQAFRAKYANLEWLEREREMPLETLFDDLAGRLKRARTGDEARAVFDRLKRKSGDGHVEIEWPALPAPATASQIAAPAAPELCSGIGYDARQNGPGTAAALPGYRALPASNLNPFEAGMVSAGGAKVGVLRIGVFQPQGFPDLCRDAVRTLRIPADKPCDESCQDRIVTWAYERLTAGLEERLRQLKAAGATVLLVDISHNGGGSEWAEAAARTLSVEPLVSERRGFVRGDHWAKQWRETAAQLQAASAKASPDDRKRLRAWAGEAEAAAREAEKPCPASGSCGNLAKAGYSTGLVGSASSGAFAGQDWAVQVFSPAQFDYHDGVWGGPLILLVDQETWSAAEEFAAVLQDNRAAVILGARTGGAGCGYTNGGMTTELANSHAVLKLPDCVRFRADGSNEVRGIIPDVLAAIRADDGRQFRARQISEKLPAAIERAQSLNRR
ncbi:MAG TPA: S41 family peptidase [Sphingomicrobium sp.]|nr:S41 family peptidase [Sphingomicrobium sp.]